MTETHVLTLPGDWNHPGLMLRLLEVVDARWQATEAGFEDQETGDTVDIAFGYPVDAMREWFSQGTDPTRPTFDDDFLEAVDGHQGVAQVHVPMGDDPIASLERALSATNSLVDGGALGVHVMSSGLAHEADAFQALMRTLEGPGDRRQALFDLVVRYQIGLGSTTIGMSALGLPDIVLPRENNPDRAVGLLEATAHRLLAGEVLPTTPDGRGGRTNRHGIVVL